MTKISKKTFSGAAKVFDGTLALVLIALLKAVGQTVLNGLTAFTDNSGGTADDGTVAHTAFPAFTAGTTDAVAKAEIEATFGVVRTNIRALVNKLNEITANFPVIPELVVNIGGTAPTPNTLAAVDGSMTGTSSGGALVANTGANTVITALQARIEQVRYWVNVLASVMNVSTLTTDTDIDLPADKTVFAAVSTDTGASTTGASTVSKAAADVALDILADNLATLAAKLNEIVSTAPVLDAAGIDFRDVAPAVLQGNIE